MRGHEAETFALLEPLREEPAPFAMPPWRRSGAFRRRRGRRRGSRRSPTIWSPTRAACRRPTAPAPPSGRRSTSAAISRRSCPTADRARVGAALDALVMRTIRIEAVRAQMKFDVSRISLAAGEEVEIEFVNADEMPHNLLITAPGALETVSLAAEAMVEGSRRRSRSTSCPRRRTCCSRRRWCRRARRVRLRFTAPRRAGRLSVRLHVPRPLADDERHRRGDARDARCRRRRDVTRRMPTHDPSREDPGDTTQRDGLAGLCCVALGVAVSAAAGWRRRGTDRAAAAGSRRKPPHVVFVTGDDEYRSEITMPMIAAILEKEHGFKTSVAYAPAAPADARTTSKGSRRSRPPT